MERGDTLENPWDSLQEIFDRFDGLVKLNATMNGAEVLNGTDAGNNITTTVGASSSRRESAENFGLDRNTVEEFEDEIKSAVLPIFKKTMQQQQNSANQLINISLPNVDANYLLDQCLIEFFDADHLILKQGDKGDRFFILIDGQVSVHIMPGELGN